MDDGLVVLGLGRVGSALVERARARGVAVTAVGREAAALPPGPILVTTRAEDLPAVLDRVPPARHPDLVLVQNGMLRGLLAERGLDPTRGLLYVAVPSRGAALEPGGVSPFTGPHAAAVVAWLGRIAVPAAVVERDAFARAEAEKLLWNTVYGLLSERLGVSVGEVAERHAELAERLIAELVPLLAPALGVRLDAAALAAATRAYSLAIPAWRGAVKEWRWRNGWFVEEARRRGVATPLHDGLLGITHDGS